MVRGALSLVVSLASVGIIFLVSGAEFIGGVQILIYVGSIVILFLFGLMLTKAPIGKETLDNQQRVLALVVALGVLAGLVFLIQDAYSLSRPDGAALPHHDRRDRGVDVLPLRAAVRGHLVPPAGRADRRRGAREKGRRGMIRLPFLLLFAAALFSAGVYGVLARRNGVLVLMSIELILNAVTINLVAFSQYLRDVVGQVFALFVIAVAAAEVGIGLAIVILIYRNRETINVDEVNLLKW